MIGRIGIAACALLGATACEVRTVNEDTEANQAAQPEQPESDPYASNPQAIARARQLAAAQAPEEQRARLREQARGELRDLRFVVDISDRELRVLSGDREVETHPVAVGSEEWPTPTGSWEFHRVDFNPEWNPPKTEDWAKDETRKAPGDPENPMGRARLVYRMPNTVHGTDDLDSLGKAVSHGSIRVANEVALNLAEMLLKAGHAWEGPQWFGQMTQDRTTEYQIELPDGIPIEVQE
ncbi:MAG: L,D-transpeptidase [Sphingomicrobium sp.]